MDFLYKYENKIKHSDLDLYDRLSPWAILELFQEAAYTHVIEQECGYSSMLEKNALWVLISVRFDYLDYVVDSSVEVNTWQAKRGRAEFIRGYELLSNGKRVVIGSSKWCLIDKDERRILPASLAGSDISGTYIDLPEITKLIFDRPKELKDKVKVDKCLIDHNYHLNNCHYARMIYNAIELDKDYIKSFEISFLNEAVYNDEITIYSEKRDNCWYVEGCILDKICFKAKVEV